MDFTKLLLGILIIILTLFFIGFELKKYSKLKKKDYMRKSLSVKTIGAVIIFIVIGIMMIYRELKHIL